MEECKISCTIGVVYAFMKIYGFPLKIVRNHIFAEKQTKKTQPYLLYTLSLQPYQPCVPFTHHCRVSDTCNIKLLSLLVFENNVKVLKCKFYDDFKHIKLIIFETTLSIHFLYKFCFVSDNDENTDHKKSHSLESTRYLILYRTINVFVGTYMLVNTKCRNILFCIRTLQDLFFNFIQTCTFTSISNNTKTCDVYCTILDIVEVRVDLIT